MELRAFTAGHGLMMNVLEHFCFANGIPTTDHVTRSGMPRNGKRKKKKRPTTLPTVSSIAINPGTPKAKWLKKEREQLTPEARCWRIIRRGRKHQTTPTSSPHRGQLFYISVEAQTVQIQAPADFLLLPRDFHSYFNQTSICPLLITMERLWCPS